MLTLLRSRGCSERGAILPLFAIFLPVIVLFVAFVLEVGNWFEHQRHLQLQADAAALAGGGVWSFPCTATAEATISNTARNYGGPDVTLPTALYNAQIGGTPASRLHMLLNSQNFWNEGGSDNTDPAGSPCSAGFIDTKVTESNLSFLIPFAGSVVPAINAHARVTIEPAGGLNGLLPLFVRDVTPKSAAAIFIDDATHTVLGANYMDHLPSTSCTSGRQCWSSLSAPSTVTVARQTSLVVALSSYDRCGTAPCLALPAVGSSADTACLQKGAECFGEDASSNLQEGLVFIRGYSTSGNGAPPNVPLLRDVELAGLSTAPTSGATCADGYFNYTSSTCTVFVRAKVDVGSTFSTSNVAIRANGNDLTFDSSSGYWQGNVSVSPSASPPGQAVTIRWAEENTTLTGLGTCETNPTKFWSGSNKCTGTFEPSNVVQRIYAGQDQFSGPIMNATVWNDDNALAPFAGLGANAYAIGDSHRLFATVALAGGVATDASDPPIPLRVVGAQAAIDCDPAISNFRQELTLGCAPFYTLNTHLSQPDPCNPPYGNNNPSLWTSPNPPFWQCVATQTGASVGEFTQGIQGRVLNDGQLCTGTCPASCPLPTSPFRPGRNYWSSDWVGGTFQVRDDDPRLVLLFMVPFGAFRGSGNSLFPITNFGAFYITGWGGGGGSNDDPCPGADPGVSAGSLSGHFVKYKLPANTGGGSPGACDPSGTTPCVAVLTQ